MQRVGYIKLGGSWESFLSSPERSEVSARFRINLSGVLKDMVETTTQNRNIDGWIYLRESVDQIQNPVAEMFLELDAGKLDSGFEARGTPVQCIYDV